MFPFMLIKFSIFPWTWTFCSLYGMLDPDMGGDGDSGIGNNLFLLAEELFINDLPLVKVLPSWVDVCVREEA